MKKIFLIVLLFASQFFWAQNTFEQGNTLYQKEKFTEAATAYESIVNSGKQSAEVYFNLGNCYYKLHKIAPAIFNYEKALQLNPNDQEIKTNLDFARKMAIDDIKVIPKVGFNKIIADFTSQYYYDTWAWVAIVFAFIFFLCFLGYYFSNTTLKKRVFFISMFIFLIGILTSVSAGVFEKNRLENEKIAIVFAETAAVKSEPKTNATDAFVLHEGAKVYVLESIANWKKIQLTDETTGWIESESIKELN
jgi:tetratricopeptide (TPR) repeat protein